MLLLIDDIIFSIANCIAEGSTWKSFLLTCSKFYLVTQQLHEDRSIKFANHLTTLLSKYPDKPWDWSKLSINYFESD